MKKLFIYCDGGFGNRYGTLLGGLAVSKHYNLFPVINWRDTSMCRLSFNEIFDTEKIEIIDEPLQKFTDCVLMMHENFVMGKENHNINSFSDIKNLPITKNKIYVYNNNWIPKWMNQDTVIDTAKTIPFKSFYLNESDKFIQKNNINELTIGLHLRSTDFNIPATKFDVDYEWIRNQQKNNFFVLSDDKTIEQKFNQLANVVVREKQHYVKKINTSFSWSNNIERTKESIVDSLIDLMILSKTNIVINSESTFLKTSLILKNINLY